MTPRIHENENACMQYTTNIPSCCPRLSPVAWPGFWPYLVLSCHLVTFPITTTLVVFSNDNKTISTQFKCGQRTRSKEKEKNRVKMRGVDRLSKTPWRYRYQYALFTTHMHSSLLLASRPSWLATLGVVVSTTVRRTS